MTVYVDSLFLLNTVLNALLLLGAARLSGAAICRWKILGAAALGGLYAVLCVLPGCAWLGSLPVKILASAGMLLLSFGPRKTALRTGLLFFALSFAFAGVVFLLTEIFNVGLVFLNGAACYPVSGRALVLTAAAVYLLVRTVFTRLTAHGGGLVPVELRMGERTARMTALRDTGNGLRDPVTNQPVLVADWRAARPLLPPEAAAVITGESLRRPAELLPRLVRTAGEGKWRLVPYRAVGTGSGLLLAMRCGEMRIGGRKIQNGLVAFSPTPLSDGGTYSALTGGAA